MAYTDRWQRHTRKYPVDQPARIEMRVRRGGNERHRFKYGEGEDGVVCNCFPQTSDFTIPSMFYDKITCPHQRRAHIQPAQETHFDYPWTPTSFDGRQKPFDDDLSERLSLMSGEDDQLRFTPGLIDRKPGDVLSVATAPPYWYEQETDPRTQEAPHTAPADYAVPPTPRRKPQRAGSMRDLRDTMYREDEYPATHRRAVTQTGQRNSRLSNRQFTGNYVDPKDGKVYQYNVNYDGTPQPKGSRVPVERPPRKLASAQ